jgi:hypothetical protein
MKYSEPSLIEINAGERDVGMTEGEIDLKDKNVIINKRKI